MPTPNARTRSRARARSILAALAVACALALAPEGGARGAAFPSFPIFAGDPVDSSSGRPFAILPGVPLILPQPDGKFDPPVVDATKTGDVDLVLRAGSPMVGPGMPPVSAPPPTAVAGGLHVVSGGEIPFTVIVSDGSTGTPTGLPIFGSAMDDIPVIVLAFADLDGDGIVGPTNLDPAGAADNARELQESNYLAGIQVAFLQSGVAQGSIAVWKGAPASAGGLGVILTAVAYVGPYDPMFLAGNVPDGPGVSTLQPVFPELDPLRTIEGNGTGGMPSPTTRLGFEFEAAFDPPVSDPALGTPFAIPVNGTSPTIDRGTVHSAAFSRARFLKPSSAAAFPNTGMEVPLFRGAGGVLQEPLASAAVADDGPGGGTHARLTPVDVLDNITDPGAGAQATLIADPGLVIASPDADADPSRETVPLGTAAGVDVVLDDDGGADDSGTASAVTVVVDGFPVDRLPVTFAPGGGPPPGGLEIRDAAFDGNPSAFVAGCPARPTLRVSVADPEIDARAVEGMLALDGVAAGKLSLRTSFAAPPNQVGATQVFVGPVQIRPRSTGLLDLSLVASDAARNVSAPFPLSFPVVPNALPLISDVMVSDTMVIAGAREMATVSARVTDDCGVSRVWAELDAGRGFRRVASMRDDGRNGDAVPGDGVFTGLARIELPAPGTYPLRIAAQDSLRAWFFSPVVDIQATAGP